MPPTERSWHHPSVSHSGEPAWRQKCWRQGQPYLHCAGHGRLGFLNRPRFQKPGLTLAEKEMTQQIGHSLQVLQELGRAGGRQGHLQEAPPFPPPGTPGREIPFSGAGKTKERWQIFSPCCLGQRLPEHGAELGCGPSQVTRPETPPAARSPTRHGSSPPASLATGPGTDQAAVWAQACVRP